MIELCLFTTDIAQARTALAAGIGSLVIDWENRGKERRQRGFDTEINRDTPEDLARLSRLKTARRICRINAWGPTSAAEIDLAVRRGATHILLPMVRSCGEVELFLNHVDGRCGVGILVETREACSTLAELARFPLDLVYVGLNDLAISRGTRTIFDALVDGTIDRIREAFTDSRLGFAGLTDVRLGDPIPCRLLLAKMVRLGAAFTFLRRSFKRDLDPPDWADAVARIRLEERRLAARDAAEVDRDEAELVAAVRRWGDTT